VLLIQRALVVGFSLADLKRILRVRDQGGTPCRTVRELVGARLDELNRRIDELIALREELLGVLEEWDVRLAETPKGQRVHLLEALGSTSHIERTLRERQASSRRRRSSTF
jgi:DNA-binding transcriptional MerR regulator